MNAAPRRRFADHYTARPEAVIGLAPGHAALREARTLFPTTVVPAEAAPRLLVSGAHSRKIGDRVSIGAWRGMPIYTLTLEERATCPRSCAHWATCYGNGMQMARRHAHGPRLEFLLPFELDALQASFPDGFVVRLHVLGDFYDAAYAGLWRRWLARYPALHLFGYTAHDRASPVGAIVAAMNTSQPGRCRLRFSTPAPDHRGDEATTIWREPEARVVPEGIVCPAQTGAASCCGACGLCWTADRTIVFKAHGRASRPRPRPGLAQVPQ